MAVRWAVQNGNWSDTATWDGGTLPDVGDDVHADGFTVTINQNITVLSIRTTQRSGGTAGGEFTISGSNRSITCDIIGGTTRCLTLTGDNHTITGNITGGSHINAGAINFSSGTNSTIIGNVTGGTSSAQGLRMTGIGDIYIIGNIIGSSNGNSNCFGVLLSGSGNLYLTGNVLGSDNGASNNGISASNGTCNITGSSIGGIVSSGINIGNSGIAIVQKAIGSSNSQAVGVSNSRNTLGSLICESLEYSSIGTPPTSGRTEMANLSSINVKILRADATFKTLIDLDNLPNELPTEANVRQGTSYNSGNKLGTLAVPSPSDVRRSVPTDNTVGTADLTAEDILNAIQTSENPVAERLRNVATADIVGSQFIAFNNT